MADMAMAIRDVGTHIVDAELLSTLGDRLALHRATFRGRNPDGFKSELLMVSESTSDGAYKSTVSFDPDDINGAVRELYERWIASGEVEHEDIARMVVDFVEGVNDKRWSFVEDMIGGAPVGGHLHMYTRDSIPVSSYEVFDRSLTSWRTPSSGRARSWPSAPTGPWSCGWPEARHSRAPKWSSHKSTSRSSSPAE